MKRAFFRLSLVAGRHLLWAQRDRVRDLLWRDRLGYEPRLHAPNRIELVDPERPRPSPSATPASGDLAALGRDSAVAGCGRFLGLTVEEATPEEAGALLNASLRSARPLLGASPETLGAFAEDSWAALGAFLRGGGTLFLAGVGPTSASALTELGRRLGLEPVQAEASSAASAGVLFPADVVDFAHELAGVEVETTVQGGRLRSEQGLRALAFSIVRGAREPSVVEQRVGAGRIVFSSFPARLPSRLADCFGVEQAPVFLPPTMLLRRVYGTATWRPPAVLANFTVDDPALREGLLGLPYSQALRIGREHGFHVTVATIPAELKLAEPTVVAQLLENPETLSACYHGCDHNGYEFYRSEGRRLRYRVRSLAEQRAALRLAVEHGLKLGQRSGYELDRVMVFPHGLGPAAILPDLYRLGFVASCNLDNRYPLEAPLPDDEYLGLRPADTAWAGFPLLWRRELDDAGHVLDLFVGRPLLTFEHRQPLGKRFLPFVQRAAEINRLTRDAVAWRSLEEVARHAYLQRRDPRRGWEVLMASNEACLHNPDPEPSSCCVWRPDLPGDAAFEIDGERSTKRSPFEVTVPAGGNTVVRLLPSGTAARLRPRVGCSIFPGAGTPAEAGPR